MKKVTELSKHLSPTKKVEKGDKDKNNKVKDIKKYLSPTMCAICHVKEGEILCDFVICEKVFYVVLGSEVA